MGCVWLFHGPHQPLEWVDFPVPHPRGAEVLVRVACCTLCTSDLHTHAGRRAEPTPTVLGHEVVGWIEAFGPEAPRHDRRGTPLTEGDRVSWSIVASCGSCFFCTHDLPQKCGALFKYGHVAVTPERAFTGGLAEYVLLVPGTALFRVPDAVPDVLAASANCATATAAAVLRQGMGTPLAGQTILILGAGILGLTACAMAHTLGALVLVSDPDRNRRERAVAFGATHTLSAERAELAQAVAETTQGRGADAVLELAGTIEAVQTGLILARVGGTVVLAGTVLPTPSVALDPEQVVRRMLTLRGVHNYAPCDLATALDFLATTGSAFPFASLVGQRFTFGEAEQAFRYAHAHPGLRVAVSGINRM